MATDSESGENEGIADPDDFEETQINTIHRYEHSWSLQSNRYKDKETDR